MRTNDSSHSRTVYLYSDDAEASSRLAKHIEHGSIACVASVIGHDLADALSDRRPGDAIVFFVPDADSSVLDRIRDVSAMPHPPDIVAVGAATNVRGAVAAIQSGARAYYTSDELVKLVADLGERAHVRFDADERLTDEGGPFARFITRDPHLHSLFRSAAAVARSSASVLITGETGVGKELFAHGVHLASGRAGEFVVENVAGLDDTLFSDALFGHRREAFTGAVSDRKGLVDRAQGGTLFLDEIGDLSAASQVKLLRLLENRTYYPLGADEASRSSARLVLATNRDILAEVKSGEFRMDLFFRLAAFHLQIPPLRSRRHDVAPLVRHFAESTAHELGIRPPVFEPSLLSLLEAYDYPGNVRELQSIVVTLVSYGRDNRLAPAELEQLARSVLRRNSSAELSPNPTIAFSETLPTIDELTDQLIDEALRRTEGNQSAAARMLGVTPSAISKRLHRRDGSG
ncbi:MAG: sigma-54-dependent transcriptional regulator [Spirochaetota bacterium]